MAWGNSFDKVVKPMQDQIKELDEELGRHATDMLLFGTSFSKVTLEDGGLKIEPIAVDTMWIEPDLSEADAKLLNDVLMQDGAISPWQSLPSVEIAEDVFVPLHKQSETATIRYSIELKKEHTNKVPTHDPYTNPNSHIYYECNCGQILDPGTKRFAELNNCASKAGWKIRFSDNGYVPYCVECGKGVE